MITLAVAWLAADLMSGIFHWWEDRYGDPDWPVLGTYVVRPNIRHHRSPSELCEAGYWERNWTTILPAATLSAACYLAGLPTAALAFAIVTQANEIHSWAHQRCSRPIRGLQLLGVLCSPEQHAAHHRQPFDRNYCTMTDLINPVLTAADAWRIAERCIEALSGIRPREDRATG